MEFEKIQEVVAEQLGKDKSEISLTTSFTEDLGADSLDLFQIVSELEEVFEIDFPQEAIEKIKTVLDAVEYVKSEMK
jgi:acyl carrier protein